MAEFSWVSRSPLDRVLSPGRYGVAGGEAGLRMAECAVPALAQVMARRGQAQAVSEAARAVFGVAAPAPGGSVDTADAFLLWSGPDQFFVLGKGGEPAALLDRLRPAFAGIASIADQSHARCLIRISGAEARNMLAKLVSLDLHPAAFAPGRVAATSMDHTSVTLWREADAGGQAVFKLLVFSTFAEDLWGTLLDAGAEYGVEVADLA